MEPTEQPSRPALSTYEDLASRAGSELLDTVLSEEHVHDAAQAARSLGLGFVTVRPCDVALVSKWLQGGPTRVSSAVSFPSGDDTTAVKVFAVRDLLQRGATGIETVLNIGKIVSRQFQYVELELLQMSQECHRAGATFTAILEMPYLAPDHRVIACRIARRVEADFIRAQSSRHGSTCDPSDLAFLFARAGDAKLDAGPVETLEQAFAAYDAGADRVLPREPAAIMAQWRDELKRRETAPQGV